MVFTNRSERNQNNSSPEPPTNKRKIDSTGEGANGLHEVNSCDEEDAFYFQVTNSFSEHCANCSVKFPISETGQAQTVKEFMSQNKATGEVTKVSVWKALSVIYQLRIRMYNNIEIATAFCLGEDGNRDLSLCIKCAMSLCRLYKSYIEFQDFSSNDSYISKLIKDKENTRPFSPPISPQSVNPRTKPMVITPIVPTRSSAKTVFPRSTLSVSNCNQRPLNLITNKNKTSNSQKMDWSPVPAPPPPALSSSNFNHQRPHVSTIVPARPQEANVNGHNNGQPVLKCGICSATFLSQILRTPCIGQRGTYRPHVFLVDKNNPESFPE